VALALFDLDNTLLGGDSDYLWGRFLVEQVSSTVTATNARTNGSMINTRPARWISSLPGLFVAPTGGTPPARLHAWREEFLARLIGPHCVAGRPAPWWKNTVPKATRSSSSLRPIAFVTAPIAARFDIEHLIATRSRWTASVTRAQHWHPLF